MSKGISGEQLRANHSKCLTYNQKLSCPDPHSRNLTAISLRLLERKSCNLLKQILVQSSLTRRHTLESLKPLAQRKSQTVTLKAIKSKRQKRSRRNLNKEKKRKRRKKKKNLRKKKKLIGKMRHINPRRKMLI